MPGDLDLAKQAQSRAAQRAAEVLVRTMGNSAAHVRVPLVTVESGNAGQLGLSGMGTRDLLLAPVVIRELHARGARDQRRRVEMMFTPATLMRCRESGDTSDARDFFASALGVIVAGKLLRIERFSADEFGGEAYLYRLLLAE